MAGCIHSDYESDKTCAACLTPEAQARGARIRSIAMKFTYGKEAFHGPTTRETLSEWQKHWKANGVEAESTARWI